MGAVGWEEGEEEEAGGEAGGRWGADRWGRGAGL